jgi:hypothetical protein
MITDRFHFYLMDKAVKSIKELTNNYKYEKEKRTIKTIQCFVDYYRN